MFTFLIISTLIVLVLLVLVASMRPRPGVLSVFELERRHRHTKENALALRREAALHDILTIQRVVVALLLVITVCLLVVTFGWGGGICLAVLVALEYDVLSKFSFVSRASYWLYALLEPSLITFSEQVRPVFRFLRGTPWHDAERYRRFDSKEELVYLIERSGEVLTPEERQLIARGLEFGDTVVESVMTPRGAIKYINQGEFLGPLVLDELHQEGHSRLPVVNGDIDHVVGTLHLDSLLSLDDKRSLTAEKAMDPKVFYIRQDQTLDHALAAFLTTHHQLFIVINENRETVGLLTIEDIIEALIGRKISDEHDHQDSKAEANNRPAGHVDV